MPNRAEVASALHGAFLLLRLDRNGMGFFARDARGFRQSFFAALIVLPAFLILLTLRVETQQWEAAGWLRILLLEGLGYVISWVAFPLLMLPVTRVLGREEQWLEFVVAYNWSQVLQYGFYAVATLLIAGGALPPVLLQLLAIAALFGPFVYEWAVVWIALDLAWPPAVMIVLLDIVLSLLISRGIEALY